MPRNPSECSSLREWSDDISSELNVREVVVTEDAGELIQYKLRPNLQTLGPRVGREVNNVKEALSTADALEIVQMMKKGETVTISGFELSAADVLVDVEAVEGWAAQEDGGYLSLLQIELDDDLIAEGMAREVIRRLQNMRRDADFDISDRIRVFWTSDGVVASAMRLHGVHIGEETLAVEIVESESPEEAFIWQGMLDGNEATFGVMRI